MATQHDRERLTAEVLQPAIDFALTLIPVAQWESKDIATDAATDAVIWCLKKLEDGERVTNWPAFVMAQVKKTVRRDMHQNRARRDTVREKIGKKNSKLDICERGGPALSDRATPDGKLPIGLLDSLTPEQAEAVRLYVVGGYTLREAADAIGISKSELSNRLKDAAEAVAGARIAEPVDSMRKKFKRG